ncbi:MAG: LacI family DNA-binding transcriptional regulator [Limisphaerales bacterium]
MASNTIKPFNQNQTPRVSMRDIARAVGVSVSAVSLAIKNSPRVSVAVRQMIQEKIREMGYQPDPMLAALCQYRHSKSHYPISAELAWINCWPVPQKLRSYREFELYWRGAFEEAERCGFRLEEFSIAECKTPARLEAILRARNIRGILIPPRYGAEDIQWENFNWDDFCIVRFGHTVSNPRAHIVTSDQLTDGMLAFESIWNKGYRRIAYVTTRDTAVKGARFSAGFLQGQLKVRAKTQLHPLLLDDENNPREHQAQLTRWLRKFKPDAIFTDIQDLHHLIARCGYHVPGNIGLAVTSVLDGNASAGIDQNSKEIGKAAIQLLISLINHNERGVPEICREVLIEGRWTDGDTLPSKRMST